MTETKHNEATYCIPPTRVSFQCLGATMRKAAVRHGDPTTTRGFVMAYSSTIHDDGKRVALSGDEATCGNCKGVFKIFEPARECPKRGVTWLSTAIMYCARATR